MNSRDKRRYDMLTRVRKFADTYGHVFPTNSTAHDAFNVVSAEISHLEALEVALHHASEVSRAERKITARGIFKDLLARAGSTARVLGKTNPQLEARIPLPLPKDDLELLTLARQFAAGVAGYEQPFEAHGIPLPSLAAGITAFDAAVQQRDDARDDRIRTRAEIEASFERALHAVATIDVTVANCLAADPVAVACWQHESRIKPPRKLAAPAAEPTPAVEAAPAAAPAAGPGEPAAVEAPALAA